MEKGFVELIGVTYRLLSVMLYYPETICNLGGKRGGVLGPRSYIEDTSTNMSTPWE